MKKEYESTIEEAVQTHYRLAEQLGTIKKSLLIGICATPIMYFAAMYVPLVRQEDKVPFAILFSIFYALGFLFYYKRGYRKQLRKILVKATGTDRPIPSCFELDGNGMAFTKQGQQVSFSWETIRKVEETENSVEIFLEPMGIAIIPKRIFKDSVELQEWISYIKQHASYV